MPVYEYKCTECGERFEVEQSMKDDALTTIPGDDHVHPVKKVFSPIGIAFKGSGFYKNDSAKSKPRPNGSTGSKSEGGSGGDAGSTTSEKKSTADATSTSSTSASSSKD